MNHDLTTACANVAIANLREESNEIRK